MSLATAVRATYTRQVDQRREATELQPEIPIVATCECLVELATQVHRLGSKQHGMNWCQVTSQLSYGIKRNIKNLTQRVTFCTYETDACVRSQSMWLQGEHMG